MLPLEQFSSGASSKQHDTSLQISVQKRPWPRAHRAARSDGGGGIAIIIVGVDELEKTSFVELVTDVIFTEDDSSPGVVEVESCVPLKMSAAFSLETELGLNDGADVTMPALSEEKVLFDALVSLTRMVEMSELVSLAFVPVEIKVELSTASFFGVVSVVESRVSSPDCFNQRQAEYSSHTASLLT